MGIEPKMILLSPTATPDQIEEFYNQCHDSKGRFCETTGSGTKEDPIVTKSFDHALKAISEGKYVRLNQPRQVSTLLDKLVENVKDAEAKGEDSPRYDMCKVSIKGTNLFCHETQGIPRAKMPQFIETPKPGSKADKLPRIEYGWVDAGPHFIDQMEKKGVKVTDETEKASYLRSTQDELDGRTVAKVVKRVQDGSLDLNSIPIFTSKDNYILDGHHRWAGAVAIDSKNNLLGDIKVPIVRVDLSITELLPEAEQFVKDWGLERSQ